jgi:hypothetical protein
MEKTIPIRRQTHNTGAGVVGLTTKTLERDSTDDDDGIVNLDGKLGTMELSSSSCDQATSL